MSGQRAERWNRHNNAKPPPPPSIPYVNPRLSTQLDVGTGGLIDFTTQFISNNISYRNGIFTIKTKGTYNVNFSVYLLNMDFPIASLAVNYTINGVSKTFNVSVKGIDQGTTGTAHSMVLPCSFATEFYAGDTISIKNITPNTLVLMGSYASDFGDPTESISSIISINN